jgi:hypothetical protein
LSSEASTPEPYTPSSYSDDEEEMMVDWLVQGADLSTAISITSTFSSAHSSTHSTPSILVPPTFLSNIHICAHVQSSGEAICRYCIVRARWQTLSFAFSLRVHLIVGFLLFSFSLSSKFPAVLLARNIGV